MKRLWAIAIGFVFATATEAHADPLLINGAGATFPFPLYSKWFSEYNKLHPDLRFNYQSIGSGGGVKQITARTVDFGASDTPMSDAELAKAPGLLHVPTCLGAVAVVYSGAPAGLKLTPDLLADIFLGKLTKWNDARIAAVNPGAKLPDLTITVAHRSDGSGTTAVFTDYLAKIAPTWKSQVGAAKSVKWPAGLGGKGNEGVTGLVKSAPGAIGYVELAYAKQNALQMAALRNAEGVFVLPSIESTSAAAAGVTLPPDFRVSITNPRGKSAYPISAFTYLLVYREQSDVQKGKALSQFLWWASHSGQKLAGALDYAPLPTSVVTRVEAEIKTITVQGKSPFAAN
jgi:phosphate transport system substrate-binding protein